MDVQYVENYNVDGQVGGSLPGGRQEGQEGVHDPGEEEEIAGKSADHPQPLDRADSIINLKFSPLSHNLT